MAKGKSVGRPAAKMSAKGSMRGGHMMKMGAGGRAGIQRLPPVRTGPRTKAPVRKMGAGGKKPVAKMGAGGTVPTGATYDPTYTGTGAYGSQAGMGKGKTFYGPNYGGRLPQGPPVQLPKPKPSVLSQQMKIMQDAKNVAIKRGTGRGTGGIGQIIKDMMAAQKAAIALGANPPKPPIGKPPTTPAPSAVTAMKYLQEGGPNALERAWQELYKTAGMYTPTPKMGRGGKKTVSKGRPKK